MKRELLDDQEKFAELSLGTIGVLLKEGYMVHDREVGVAFTYKPTEKGIEAIKDLTHPLHWFIS